MWDQRQILELASPLDSVWTKEFPYLKACLSRHFTYYGSHYKPPTSVSHLNCSSLPFSLLPLVHHYFKPTLLLAWPTSVSSYPVSSPQVIPSLNPFSVLPLECYFHISTLNVSFFASNHQCLLVKFTNFTQVKSKLLIIYSENSLCLPLARIFASSPPFPFAFPIQKCYIVVGTCNSSVCLCVGSFQDLGLPTTIIHLSTSNPSKLTWNISATWWFLFYALQLHSTLMISLS